ncbi:MAG TPA: DinB family protein [Chloroflexota bacterium]|nr:DinB family protein [Chloroflexota bacterium]
MDAETLRELFRYHFWVNDRLLQLIPKLTAEQTRERFGASFDSIHGTLAHLAAAETVWLARWRGTSPAHLLGANDFPTVAEVQDHWTRVRADVQTFLDGVTDAQLAAPLRWTNTSGNSFELPMWQTMMQVVNHGTHHRAELCDMLTRSGFPPPPTDIIVYFAERAGQM